MQLRLLIRKKFSSFMGVLALLSLFVPLSADAFSFSDFFKGLFGSSVDTQQTQAPEQKPFPFLAPVTNSDPKAAHGGGGIEIVDDAALVPVTGPMGSLADVEDSTSYRITTYKVRTGDTIPLIAKMFDISPSTIRWANNIPKNGSIKPGDTLVILPVSGVKHTVVRGDTVVSIAKKYGSDPDDIYDFNDLTTGQALEVGSVVIVPDGEVSTPPETAPSAGTTRYVRGSGPEISGYYIRPIRGGVRSRGIHGYNGVDLANSCGTPVYASAAGTVITARDSGWNGGYGEYIVIAHSNGTQTLYGHLSALNIGAGWNVAQNQQIGLMGTTGKSTGCHLHFEVRGAKNPF